MDEYFSVKSPIYKMKAGNNVLFPALLYRCRFMLLSHAVVVVIVAARNVAAAVAAVARFATQTGGLSVVVVVGGATEGIEI